MKQKGNEMKIWMGSTKCDICGCECKKELIDGATREGPWAVMCPKCHRIHGCGLGSGVGQKYVRNLYGEFIKVEKKRKVSSERAMMVRIAMEMGLTREEAEMEVNDYLG
jgi:hypothetical protein